MRSEEARRLEQFVRARLAEGGVKALANRAGLKRQTIYQWFRAETQPDLESLRLLAKALGTSRAAVLAAMDGERLPSPVDDAYREALLAEARAVLAAALAEQVLPAPPRVPSAPSRGRPR